MRSSRFDIKDDQHISWSVFYKLLPYLGEFKQRVALALLCLVLAKVASVALPFVLKYSVDSLNDPATITPLLLAPIALVIAYGGFRFLNVILGEVRDTLFGRVTERAMRRLGLEVFEHLHRLDLRFHLSRQTGGLSRDIDRGTNGISFLMRFMVFNIGPTLLEIAFVVGILFTNYGVTFALIILVSVVLYVFFSMKATDWRTRYVREVNQADNQTNTRAVDSLLNYETVKYFNNEAYEANLYDTNLARWETARRSNRLSLFALNGGQALIIASAMTAMLILAALEVQAGTMTIGDFVLINAFTMQIFMPLNFLGFVYREIRGALANIENLFTLLKTKVGVEDTSDAKPISITQGHIRFEQVNFHYEENRHILKDISFEVPAGSKVAIVGPSGSGKSTLAKLLFRFFDPISGSISIDGQDIKHYQQLSLRSSIGIVPQDTVLFNDTLRANIQYGDTDADENALQKAIKMSQLSEFVAKLPEGLDTQVGERGLKLSGGEKQRVAIARTILKNPPIVIFDEATSSLDSHSEQGILSALDALAQQHTAIVIAHRLSTIQDADIIIVLEDGIITEQGNHADLMSQNGIYAGLWQAQQKRVMD
ncbi:ABC transporter ATP-binding protein/permease [Glaciecola sp. HTCC2999]|uniref:ABCB family ABC transporter ATP-binding protein/permease n=1 Tax=Glaciecola sp. HTCC2999 TaxID=455436 RepID=UPI0000E11036|nr:ABC transporter ATP-binding protein/permease [Glaciecola sp. HTCC2999]